MIFTLHLSRSTTHSVFFFNDTATTEIYTLSLHDALPILWFATDGEGQATDTSATLPDWRVYAGTTLQARSEEHTSELQSQSNLVCRLLLEKKKESHRHQSR